MIGLKIELLINTCIIFLQDNLVTCSENLLYEIFSILIDFLKEEYSPAHIRPRGGRVRRKVTK